ncbi:MAG: HAD family hydrolase [Deltaproteobacteria bacterium]|nr:MAG: HAD family hydrolase [Deltaproteobacteria bacterium]
MYTLVGRRYWVFDMDGTLTVPQHDFSSFKAQHGLPAELDVLAGIETLPDSMQGRVHRAVDAWERELAAGARAMPDAVALLQGLRSRGVTLGILTRNTAAGAEVTLRAAGLSAYFPDPACVLGRTCAEPKPSPDGIQRLLRRWGARPEQAVMVGDWLFDAQAGRAAGVATLLVARHGPVPKAWHPFADRVVERLDEVLGEL